MEMPPSYRGSLPNQADNSFQMQMPIIYQPGRPQNPNIMIQDNTDAQSRSNSSIRKPSKPATPDPKSARRDDSQKSLYSSNKKPPTPATSQDQKNIVNRLYEKRGSNQMLNYVQDLESQRKVIENKLGHHQTHTPTQPVRALPSNLTPGGGGGVLNQSAPRIIMPAKGLEISTSGSGQRLSARFTKKNQDHSQLEELRPSFGSQGRASVAPKSSKGHAAKKQFFEPIKPFQIHSPQEFASQYQALFIAYEELIDLYQEQANTLQVESMNSEEQRAFIDILKQALDGKVDLQSGGGQPNRGGDSSLLDNFVAVRTELRSLQAMKTELEKKLQNLEEKANYFEQEAHENRELKVSLEEEVKRLGSLVAGFEKQKVTLVSEKETLLEYIDEKENILHKYEEELNNIRGQSNEEHRHFDNLLSEKSQAIHELSKELEATRHDLSLREKELNETRSLLSEREDQIHHLTVSGNERQELERLRIENANIQEMLGEYKTRLERERTSKAEEIKSLFEQNSKSRAELREAREDNQRLELENRGLLEDLNAMKDHLEKKNKEVSSLQKELRLEIHQKYDHLSNQIRSLTSTLRSEGLRYLSGSFWDPVGQPNDPDNQVKEIRSLVEGLFKSLEEKRKSIGDLERELNDQIDRNRDLQYRSQEIHGMSRECEKMERENRTLVEKVNYLERENKVHGKEYEEARLLLRQAEAENGKLRAEIAAVSELVEKRKEKEREAEGTHELGDYLVRRLKQFISSQDALMLIDEAASLMKEYMFLERKKRDHQITLAALEEERQNSTEGMFRQRRRVDELRDNISEVENNLLLIKDKKSTIEYELSKIEGTERKKQDSIREVEKLYHNLKAEYNILKTEMETIRLRSGKFDPSHSRLGTGGRNGNYSSPAKDLEGLKLTGEVQNKWDREGELLGSRGSFRAGGNFNYDKQSLGGTHHANDPLTFSAKFMDSHGQGYLRTNEDLNKYSPHEYRLKSRNKNL